MPHPDVRGSDVGLAVIVAAGVLVGAWLLLLGGGAVKRTDHAPVSVAIRPVGDPLAPGDPGQVGQGLGGGAKPKAKRDDEAKAEPKTRRKRTRSRKRRPRSRPRPDPSTPADPDAASETEPPPDLDPEPKDGEPSDDADDGSSDAPESEGGGEGEGEGEGGQGAGAGAAGAGDALAARIVAQYRQRLSRWLSARFRVTGSGLTRDELLKIRVRATIRIDDEGRITGYDIAPSGFDSFDRAAKRALDSIVGEIVPRPPDGYPGARPDSLSTVFKCKESTCS